MTISVLTGQSILLPTVARRYSVSIFLRYNSVICMPTMANSSYINNRKSILHSTALPSSRSNLYAAESYHGQADNTNFQRFTDFPNFFDTTSSQQWTEGLVPPQTDTTYNTTAAAAGIWCPRNASTSFQTPYCTTKDFRVYTEDWCDYAQEPSAITAMTTPYGNISLRLHSQVRVDMTIDRAVRITDFKNGIILSLNGRGSEVALLHPTGRVYQYGSRVEILTNDAGGNNRCAKMWYKGISFTSEQCALVYLVDAAGTRTTTENFLDMRQDFSLSVFYSDSRQGAYYIHEANSLFKAAQHWITDKGTENWKINNVRVSQTPNGIVSIYRNSSRCQLRASPSNGTASLTTPFLHCTASMGQTPHLFVRRGERRMYYDGANFIVRNANHSAGFNKKNQLTLYN